MQFRAIPDRMRRLRVAQVTLGLAMGGKERVIAQLARNCDRDRFDIVVVSLGSPGAIGEELRSAGFAVHALDCPEGFRPGLIIRLARFFKSKMIDVVHTHDDRSAIHALPAAVMAGVKKRLHTQHHSQIIKGARLKIHMVAWVGRLANPFICVSQFGAALMRSHGIPAASIAVVPNGIDLTRFRFSGPNPHGPAVTVGRLSPEKDLTTLLRGVARIAGKVPDFRLEIVGDGPSRSELESLARALSVEDRVSLLGERRDIPELLSRARMYVLPSLTEGLSLSLLEAMARGIPVVATKVGGTPEVVLDGTSGLLVPPGDPETLAAAILRLWEDPNLATSIARRARARIEQDFDQERAISKYEALYLSGALPGVHR